MNLENIKFVLDITETDKLDRYLQNGWILIKAYTTCNDPVHAKEDQTLHYAIGATSEVDYSKELNEFNNPKHYGTIL